MAIGYMEVRVTFDRYVEGSLKEKTRKTRATSGATATDGHVVHDSMSTNTISLKQLLSCTPTKHTLTCYLDQGLLERFDGRDLTLVVVYDTVAKTVNPRRPIETHSHEEADTLIPYTSFSALKSALIARWTYGLLILTSSYYSWSWYHEGILGR